MACQESYFRTYGFGSTKTANNNNKALLGIISFTSFKAFYIVYSSTPKSNRSSTFCFRVSLTSLFVTRWTANFVTLDLSRRTVPSIATTDTRDVVRMLSVWRQTAWSVCFIVCSMYRDRAMLLIYPLIPVSCEDTSYIEFSSLPLKVDIYCAVLSCNPYSHSSKKIENARGLNTMCKFWNCVRL